LGVHAMSKYDVTELVRENAPSKAMKHLCRDERELVEARGGSWDRR